MDINVYLCDCGENIAGLIDQDKVLKELSTISGVKNVKRYDFLCSGKGLKYLEEDIKKDKPTHVVVAACTPKKHEITFRRACKAAGMNPYLHHRFTSFPIEGRHQLTGLPNSGFISQAALRRCRDDPDSDRFG